MTDERQRKQGGREAMADDNAKAEIGWGPCCFCGQEINPDKIDPCRITVETSSKGWQVWFCHAECFRSHMRDDPMLEPAIF